MFLKRFYFVISSFLLLLASMPVHAQKLSACPNSDFSSGNFTNWVGHTSIYPYNTPNSNVNTSQIPYYYTEGIVSGRQTIMTNATPDPFTCGNVLTLPPNEKACVRLGNGGFGTWGDGASYQRDFLSYTFSITPYNPLLLYKYAVVLQDPSNQPHAKSIRPRFIINIKDKNGKLIDPVCGKKEDFADTTVAGFRNCKLAEANKLGVTAPDSGDIVYRAWTTVGVDLRKYIGQDVTIEFETWDCGLGAHFGYAYVMAKCDSLQLRSEACTPNGSVTLTAPDGFAYKWFPGGQTTRSIDILDAKPGDSVYVELTTISGCKTLLGTRIFPTVTKAQFAGPKGVCLHSPISFKDSSYSYLTVDNSKLPITSWIWRFGDGTISTQQHPVHTYQKAGTFKVTLVAINHNGCKDSIIKTVIVGPAPVANFSVENACMNTTQKLKDLSTTEEGTIDKWLWTFGDDHSESTAQHPTHTFHSAGTFPITLKVITNLGCSHDTTFPVTILPLPIAAYKATSVCIGHSTQFTDQSVADNPADPIKTRIWDFGDSSSLGNSVHPVHEYHHPGVFRTSLIVSTLNGCVAKASVEVIVHALPKPNFTATPLCLSTPVKFTDLSAPKGEIAKWYWSFGNKTNTHSSQQNPEFKYDTSDVYKPKLMVQSIHGCMDSITLSVDIPPLPMVDFDADKYKGCRPLCIHFSDYSFSSKDPIKSWQWTFGDGKDTTSPSPSHCYIDVGVYTVSLTVETKNTCKQSFSWKDMIEVYPYPVADFEPSPTETTESNSLIHFYDRSQGAVSWGWDFGDDSSSTVSTQDAQHRYRKPGTYQVWQYIVNSFGCRDSISKPIRINPEWSFYVPNAFTPGSSKGINDGFTGYGTNIKEFEMWIFDRWGNAIYHCNRMDEPWNGSVENGLHGEQSAQEDVYVWKIKLKDCNNQPHNYIGIVTLVR
jgi:gliding motility-associated-like protein